jgi:hypothetical protein
MAGQAIGADFGQARSSPTKWTDNPVQRLHRVTPATEKPFWRRLSPDISYQTDGQNQLSYTYLTQGRGRDTRITI